MLMWTAHLNAVGSSELNDACGMRRREFPSETPGSQRAGLQPARTGRDTTPTLAARSDAVWQGGDLDTCCPRLGLWSVCTIPAYC